MCPCIAFGGAQFTYDNIGNPTTYRGKSVTCEYGRNLVSYNGVTFNYDGRGRRISKTQGDNTIEFTYDFSGNILEQSNGLEFSYDNNNGLIGIKYNDNTYAYRKDAQGNIIALLDSNGNVVVKYVYDAWGNHEVKVLDSACTELSQLNPFRYRSYYYDTETGLYYLQTRYYDPEVGRFITIDGIDYADPATINGLNLYAYCCNNPVAYCDPDGTFVITLTVGLSFCAALLFGAAVEITFHPIQTCVEGSIDFVEQFIDAAKDYSYNEKYENPGIGALDGIIAGMSPGVALPSLEQLTTPTVPVAQEQFIVPTAIGLTILFASTNRPGDNRKQNEQYREAMRKLGYKKTDWQWRYGHDHLPNESLGFKDLLGFLKELFEQFKK